MNVTARGLATAKVWTGAKFAAAVLLAGVLVGTCSGLRAAPADVAALVQAAEQHFQAGDYPTAISTLKAAISRNPNSAEAYYWLGRSYFELRDFANSVAQAAKAVALDGRNSVYHEWLGRAYGEQAQKERSVYQARRVKKEFEQAVLLDPSNIPARRDLEEYCIKAPWIIGGSKDQAYAQVQAIAQINPIEGHLAQAAYYDEEANRPDLAEREYRQVLIAKPAQIDPYFEVMHFYQERNQPAQMAPAIAAAAEVNPKDPRLTYYRGVSLVLSHADPDAAEANLKSFLATTPDRSDWPPHASAREWLGKLYESRGQAAAAAEQYRAALQLDPDRSELRERLRRLE